MAGYWRRLSGPLLDRIDVFVGVERADLRGLIVGDPAAGAESDRIRQRVVEARGRQRHRWEKLAGAAKLKVPAGAVNAALPPRLLRRACQLPAKLRSEALEQVESLGLSARGWHRVLRLSRTIADLAGDPEIGRAHLLEALQYRQTVTPRAARV